MRDGDCVELFARIPHLGTDRERRRAPTRGAATLNDAPSAMSLSTASSAGDISAQGSRGMNGPIDRRHPLPQHITPRIVFEQHPRALRRKPALPGRQLSVLDASFDDPVQHLRRPAAGRLRCHCVPRLSQSPGNAPGICRRLFQSRCWRQWCAAAKIPKLHRVDRPLRQVVQAVRNRQRHQIKSVEHNAPIRFDGIDAQVWPLRQKRGAVTQRETPEETINPIGRQRHFVAPFRR